jgi:23S rRNA pseudouridine1911/1915/1917 synthase
MSSTSDPVILYEDDFFLVLNKPYGMVANISETSPEGTLQNFLITYLKLKKSKETEFSQRSGLLHRLDKETSGVILAAKDEETFKLVKKQFVERKVLKTYLALVWGKMDEKRFQVNAPLKRDPRNRLKMALVSDGRSALTEGEVLKTVELSNLSFSLILLKPKTGRTHQIRVHLAALKHPVVGDSIYMTRKQLSEVANIFERMLLHAWKISLYHPKLQKEVNFEAPLPPELDKIYSKPA